MSRIRIAAGAAGLAVGLLLTGGVAGAQVVTDNSSEVLPQNELNVGGPGSGEAANNAETNANNATVRSESVGAAAQAAPEGSLPVTGGDIAGLLVLGGAAVGAGALLVSRSRATSTVTA